MTDCVYLRRREGGHTSCLLWRNKPDSPAPSRFSARTNRREALCSRQSCPRKGDRSGPQSCPGSHISEVRQPLAEDIFAQCRDIAAKFYVLVIVTYRSH